MTDPDWTPLPLDAEIRVASRKSELVSVGDTVTIGDAVLSLDALEQISYWWTARRINGTYQGHLFSIKLKHGDTKGHWLVNTGPKDKDLANAQDGYWQMVSRLEMTAAPRLADALVDRIRAGETLSLPGIAINATGVKSRRPLAKTIPWASIVGTQRELDYLRILIGRGESSKDKKKFLLHPDQWNIVLVPRIVAALAG